MQDVIAGFVKMLGDVHDSDRWRIERRSVAQFVSSTQCGKTEEN
jgi:hypothetical protein